MKKNIYQASISLLILVISTFGSFDPSSVVAIHVDGSSTNGHGTCSGDECSSVSDAVFICNITANVQGPAGQGQDMEVGFDWNGDVTGAQSSDIDWVTTEATVTDEANRTVWLGYSAGEDYSSGMANTNLSPGNYVANVYANLNWRSDVNHQGGVPYNCSAYKNFNVPDEVEPYVPPVVPPSACSSITSFTADDYTLPNGGSTTLHATFNGSYPWIITELGSQEWLIGSGTGNSGSVSTGAMNNSKVFRVRCGDQFQDLSVVVDGGTCTDPSATNNGYPLPCSYPPGALCTDPSATNNGQPLPCNYPSESVFLTPQISGPLCAEGSYTATISWPSVDNNILIFVNQEGDQPGWGFTKEVYGGGGSTPVPAGFTQRIPPPAPQTLTLLPGIEYTTFIQNNSEYDGPTVGWEVQPCSTMSGTLTPSTTTCTIPSGASTCSVNSVNMNWTLLNPVGTPTKITAVGMPDITVSNVLTSPQSGTRAVTVPYPLRTFYLYNNATELANATVSGVCAANTDWDGAKCDPYVCGDSVIEGPESCDDGNTTNGDGCSSTCSVEGDIEGGSSCGDGEIDPPNETCDDGDTQSGDGCSAACTVEYPGGGYCKDGNVQNPPETCDKGPNYEYGTCLQGRDCSTTCEINDCKSADPRCDLDNHSCISPASIVPNSLKLLPGRYNWMCNPNNGQPVFECNDFLDGDKRPIFIED